MSRSKRNKAVPSFAEELEPRLLLSASYGPQQLIGDPGWVRSMVMADIDGDGHKDIVAVTNLADTVAWYRNNGGQFQDVNPISTKVAGPVSVAVGDINGDGTPDVVVASGLSKTIQIAWFANDGTGTFGAKNVVNNSDWAYGAVALADMDGDGDLDIVAVSRASDVVEYYANDGTGQFTATTVSRAGDVNASGSLVLADVDCDGKEDIVLASASPTDGKVHWYKNNGNGTFGPQQMANDTAAQPGSLFTVTAGDFNGDGYVDLATASSGDNTVALLMNDGTGHFNRTVIASNISGACHIISVDVDNDGALDIAATGVFANKVVVYTNDGSGAFSSEHVVTTSLENPTTLESGDLDGDGFKDLIVGGVGNPQLTWYRNQIGDVFDTGPEIQVTDDSGPGDNLGVTLPTTATGATSAPAAFTVANRGNQTLDITNFSVGGADADQFVVTVKDNLGQVVNGDSFSIDSGDTYTVEVVLAPTNMQPADKAASISFNTNDPDDDEGTITLTMAGTARLPSDPPTGGAVRLERAVMKGKKITGYVPLTASNFTGLNEIVRVVTDGWADDMGNRLKFEYYIDTNGNGQIDVGVDQLLGSGQANRTANWGSSFSSGSWTHTGLQTILVRAQDTDGLWSEPVSGTMTFANYAVRQGRSAVVSDGLGGSAKVSYSGPGEAGFIENAAGGFDSLGVAGSTVKTSLTISKASSKIPLIQVHGIDIAADMKALKATGMTLSGDLHVAGFIPTVSLASAQNGLLTMGGQSTQSWTLTTGEVNAFDVNSASAIKKLSATKWVGGSTISAPSLTSMSVKGWLDSTTVTCTGFIGSVSVGGIEQSRLLAGVDAIEWLPTTAAEFVNADSYIKSFKNTGKASTDGYSFINSVIAAPNVLSASVLWPELHQGGDAYGVSASVLLKSVSVKYLNNALKTSLKLKNVLPLDLGLANSQTIGGSDFTLSSGTV